MASHTPYHETGPHSVHYGMHGHRSLRRQLHHLLPAPAQRRQGPLAPGSAGALFVWMHVCTYTIHPYEIYSKCTRRRFTSTSRPSNPKSWAPRCSSPCTRPHGEAAQLRQQGWGSGPMDPSSRQRQQLLVPSHRVLGACCSWRPVGSGARRPLGRCGGSTRPYPA